jgi:hypothetical protein
MQLGGYNRFSQFSDTLSGTEYDQLAHRLAGRDYNIKPELGPKRPTPKPRPASWDSLSTEDWRRIGQALIKRLER